MEIHRQLPPDAVTFRRKIPGGPAKVRNRPDSNVGSRNGGRLWGNHSL